MTSIQRVCLIAICFCALFAKIGSAQVTGLSGVLESTSASEIDGWSETDIDYNTAYYYNVAVIGYLFEGQTQLDAKASDTDYVDNSVNPPIVWAGVETTAPAHQGSVYTVYSEHYLEAYYYYEGVGYYNPSYYPPGSYFTSPGGGDPSGTGYDPGGGLQYVDQEIIYLGYTYFQFSTAPPSISSISPKSNFRGASGTIHVQGQNLKDDLGRIGASFRDSDISANVNVNAADASQADVSYSISSTASIGDHQLVMSNTWGESEPATFTVPYPPATITGISPNTWTAGQSYNGVQITGTNFGTSPIVTLSDPTINVSAPYNTSTTNGSSTTYVNLYIPPTTPSEPIIVTLAPGPYTQVPNGPPLPASGTATVVGLQQSVCPDGLGTDGHSGFSSIASSGVAIGATGSMTVSFSRGSFNGFSVTVPYGQFSTPESVASHIASLITQKYYSQGLSAQAVGSQILYKSSMPFGNANFTSSGSSFTANPSPNSCPSENLNYVLAVQLDTVVWKYVDNSSQRGRQLTYVIKNWKWPWSARPGFLMLTNPQYTVAQITEHLTDANGPLVNNGIATNNPVEQHAGQFGDVLGTGALTTATTGVFTTNRWFSVSLDGRPLPGSIRSYDKAGTRQKDQIEIHFPTNPSQPLSGYSIINGYDGSKNEDISLDNY